VDINIASSLGSGRLEHGSAMNQIGRLPAFNTYRAGGEET